MLDARYFRAVEIRTEVQIYKVHAFMALQPPFSQNWRKEGRRLMLLVNCRCLGGDGSADQEAKTAANDKSKLCGVCICGQTESRFA